MGRTHKNIQTYSMKFSCFNLRFSSWQHKQTVREGDCTFMQDPYGGVGDSWKRSERWRKRRVRRGRVSLTQYFESQEDQDITKLLNFTRTQERGRNGVFYVLE